MTATGDRAGNRTVGELLASAERRLGDSGKEAPRMQATALLGHVTGHSRAGLLARLNETVDAAATVRFDRLVEQRAAGHPLQYLLGRASFLDFEVRVGPGVFIPRPETEQVVERAIASWPGRGWIVDLCTGSGAIAIAIARALPRANILAIDQSPTAIESARASAADAGVERRVHFVRGDLLTAIRATDRHTIGMIVSNPPYAGHGEVVQTEVLDHEPRGAWEAGPTGLEAYRRIVPQAAERLAAGAPLVLELGYDQHHPVAALVGGDGRWGAVTIEPDFQNIPRVLSVQRA